MKSKKPFLTLLVMIITFVAFLGFSSATKVKAISQDEILSYFSKAGDAEGENGTDGLIDYVKNITYEDFTADNFSGSGVMVYVRNKAINLVDNEDDNNDTNPMLLDFPATRYPVGVKLNKEVVVSDNTANDTLMELSFPGLNDNWQTCGIKILIQDTENPDKYIALFLWRSYSCTSALDDGIKNIIAAAAGTWEKTSNGPDVYISDAGFDTDNYKGAGKFVKVGSDIHDGSDGSDPNDGCFLNTKEYGHNRTDVRFSKQSPYTFKIQFDYASGKLFVNGVRIRDFKNYSADGEHYFDGFTNGKAKLSVGYVRSTRRSTDEFTRFCIMNVDKHANIIAPQPRLIASGVSELPKPTNYSLFEGETAVDTPFKVNITDPSGIVTENYSESSFKFDKVGTYSLEYFSGDTSLGTTQFITAFKDQEGNLSEVESFKLSDNLFFGKEITLEDFILKVSETISITSADVTILKNGLTLKSFENVDDKWKYAIEEKGELTFVVSNDNFTLQATTEVRSGIRPSSSITNGSVSINGFGEATTLLSGANELVITPNDGYKLKSLKVKGADVTSDVFDSTYTINVTNIDENITYEITFEPLPSFNITFKADDETINTISVLEGTLFKEVNAPEIPKKDGYDTVGWNVEYNAVISSDLVVQAVYKLKTYTITFNSNGGTQFAPKQYTSLETVNELTETPTKEGYKFEGWYLGDKKFELGNKLTQDIVLTAKYSPINSGNNGSQSSKSGCKSSINEIGIGTMIIATIALLSLFVIRTRKNSYKDFM